MHSLINYRGIQNLKLKQQPHAESTIGRLGNGLIIGEGTTMYTNHHSHRQQLQQQQQQQQWKQRTKLCWHAKGRRRYHYVNVKLPP